MYRVGQKQAYSGEYTNTELILVLFAPQTLYPLTVRHSPFSRPLAVTYFVWICQLWNFIYSWSLNNTGWNCVGPLIRRFFSINTLNVFSLLYDFHFFLLKIKFILFFREGKGGRKRGGETSMCGCLSHAPYWGPGRKPRLAPWLEIGPVTLWFTGWRSIHWATPARAHFFIF